MNQNVNTCVTQIVLGCVAAFSIILIARMFYDGNMHNSDKARAVRTSKIEACRTIQDEALRAFCVVEGGEKENR